MADRGVTDEDLTAKARIRNTALALFAERGVSGVSLRTVAKDAGVTVSLVQHHFKTKEGLRTAVEQLVVDYHARAIAAVPDQGPPADVAAARDAAVRSMLIAHPPVVDYLRRSLLDPGGSGHALLARLTELARSEVSRLRAANLASTDRPESDQVVGIMVRQVGELFLQPLVDAVWAQVNDPTTPDAPKPELVVTTRPPTRWAGSRGGRERGHSGP